MKVLVKFPEGHKNIYDTSASIEELHSCFPGAELEVLESDVSIKPYQPEADLGKVSVVKKAKVK